MGCGVSSTVYSSMIQVLEYYQLHIPFVVAVECTPSSQDGCRETCVTNLERGGDSCSGRSTSPQCKLNLSNEHNISQHQILWHIPKTLEASVQPELWLNHKKSTGCQPFHHVKNSHPYGFSSCLIGSKSNGMGASSSSNSIWSDATENEEER